MQRTDKFNQRSCPRPRIIKLEIQRDTFISLTKWVQDNLNCVDY